MSTDPAPPPALAGLRAAAALSLTGRYAGPGVQAAAGLHAWAAARGVDLRIEDDRSDPVRTGALYRTLAGGCDLLFGPYGSGPTRAAARALAGSPAVMWNHGGAATDDDTGARVVSVIGPAERYWAGLAPVLAAAGVPLERVAVLHAPTGFGRATAAGAVSSLDAAGARPLLLAPFDEANAAAAALGAIAAGARAVVGCGRIEDDLALGVALAGRAVAVGLVVCGVAMAAERLGDAVEGWFGPAVWWPGGPAPPIPLPAGVDYPAAQAMAAGLIAERALAAAGSADPDRLWPAALALRTRTFLGPFAVDARGAQTALAPRLVFWERGAEAPRRVQVWPPPPT